MHEHVLFKATQQKLIIVSCTKHYIVRIAFKIKAVPQHVLKIMGKVLGGKLAQNILITAWNLSVPEINFYICIKPIVSLCIPTYISLNKIARLPSII